MCSLPVASALRAAFPESEIVWLVDKRFAGVVECCTAVSRVEQVKPGLRPSSWPKPPGEFDAAFDLQGLFKSAISLRGLRCPRFGYHWQREGAGLFSRPVIPDPSSAHIVDQYVDVVRAFGLEVDRASFSLVAKPEDVDRLELPDGPFVAVNPGAAWITKRWPPQFMAQTVDWLYGRGFATVLLGGPARTDQQSAQDVVDLCQNPPINMTGKTSVRQLVALISRAAAHLGADTGSSHIAAALGVPAVGLYSITRPQRSCPYGQIAYCLYDPQGLEQIQPSQVSSVLERVLDTQ